MCIVSEASKTVTLRNFSFTKRGEEKEVRLGKVAKTFLSSFSTKLLSVSVLELYLYVTFI